jgi:hypothetical protein
MCEDLNIAVPLYVQKQIFPMCSKSSQRKKSAPRALTVGQFAELLVRCAHYLTEVNVKLKQAGKLMTADETEVAPCLRALLRTRFLSWSRLNTPDSFRVEIFRSPQVEAAMSPLKRAVEHREAVLRVDPLLALPLSQGWTDAPYSARPNGQAGTMRCSAFGLTVGSTAYPAGT